jgi:hypothetical protein
MSSNGASNAGESAISNPNTLTGAGAALDLSSGSGAAAVEPSASLVPLLYYLVQTGINFQPWAYAAIALAFQSSNTSPANGGWTDLTAAAVGQNNQESSGSSALGATFPNAPATSSAGAQGQPQPFIYQDSAGSNPTSNLAHSNSLAAALSNPQFNSWAALLSPPLAAGQALVGALDQTGAPSNSLLAATSLAQG